MSTFFRNILFIWGICFIACSFDPLEVDWIIESNDVESPKDSTITESSYFYKDSIVVMQWNIGHFSQGAVPSSRITDSDYLQRLQDYRQLINDVSADIVTLCEYSVLFSDTELHPNCYADTLLFNEYPFRFIGNNGIIRGYSLNAIMSKMGLLHPSSVEYQTNSTASITHISAIKATDYYYNKAFIYVGDHKVVLVNTHLAFDKNNPDIAINQIKELINELDNEEYVVICGDFNTSSSNYKLFSEAGYSLANTGVLRTFPSSRPTTPLDNIISKGLSIRDAHIVSSSLSDHYPIVCTISTVD